MSPTTSDASRLSKEVLVFAGRPEGGLDDADRGILNEGGKLAALLGAAWAAACFPVPENLEADGEDAFGVYGTPEVVTLEADRPLGDYPDAQAEALAQAARARGTGVILLPHNDLGATLAAGVSHAMGAALFTEAIQLDRGEEGVLLYRRALGERAVEARLWDGGSPLVLTLDPRRLSAVALPSVQATEPVAATLQVSLPTSAFHKRVTERIPPDPQTVDVSEAEVIFCAGKGFDAQTFEQFRELARLLNASLGVTRPVYDLGWAGFERMIGQTGKTVAPRFYLGMGISGSMHHVGGIKDSKRLISLNIDAKAPMFPNSDEGFVADVREVLPLLLDKVRAQAAGARTGGAS